MRYLIVLTLAVTAATSVAGCATHAPAKPTVSTTTALTSCESDQVLPPKLNGAARTGADSQPVLIVGCALH